MPSPLSATVDRWLLQLVHARARRRSLLLSLLPPRWLASLLAPRAKRLRTQLEAPLIAVSVVLLAAGFFLALQ